MEATLLRLSNVQRAAIAVSVILAGFLVIDPLVLQAVRQFDSGTRDFFKSFTDLGKSGWILVPLGLAIIGLYFFRRCASGFRRAAASGYMMQLLGFLFLAIAGVSLSSSLIKNILGRARPKLFDTLGPFEFQPFTFDYDFASFPSGHATTICALGACLAILWPRWRALLFALAACVAATRFLIGSHYISDVMAGGMLGFGFPYFLRGRMAERRWLFKKTKCGEIKLRGGLLGPWS